MAEELSDFKTGLTQPPAVKCSYCGRTYEDKNKDRMGFEADDWAVCFRCFKKACDKVAG